MKNSGTLFAAAVKTYTERALRSEDSHPTREQMQDFADRNLPPGEKDRIEGHLALCADCTDFVLESRRRSSLPKRLWSFLASPRFAHGLAGVCVRLWTRSLIRGKAVPVMPSVAAASASSAAADSPRTSGSRRSRTWSSRRTGVARRSIGPS